MPSFEIVTIEQHLIGYTEAHARLKWMEHALADLHGPLEEIVDDIHRQTVAQFASEGAALGDPWAPLDPSTVEDKTRSGDMFPTWPLVATGAMMDSATSNDGPYSVGDTYEQEAWLGLDFERDGYNIPLLQQLGVPRRQVTAHRHHKDGSPYTVTYWWHLPSRPFWEATDALADEGADQIIARVFNPIF